MVRLETERLILRMFCENDAEAYEAEEQEILKCGRNAPTVTKTLSTSRN